MFFVDDRKGNLPDGVEWLINKLAKEIEYREGINQYDIKEKTIDV